MKTKSLISLPFVLALFFLYACKEEVPVVKVESATRTVAYVPVTGDIVPGSSYIGPYQPSPSLEYVFQDSLVIEGLEFTGTDASILGGRCLTLWKCENVIIRNCKFKNVRWNTAIYAENSLNVTVTDCVFENVYQALRAGGCRGNIKFEKNEVKNLVRGLHDNSGGGGVQIAESNGPGYSVKYNVFECFPEDTYTIDVIGTYKSNGTAESPIMIKGNWIRGGGPTLNGGGIILGDFGGSYQIAEDNILVDPGQYGIAIAGGHNMTLRHNKVYGRQQPFTNVGLVCVNWTEAETGPSYNITVENNAINYISMNGNFGTAWFSDEMKAVVPNWQAAMIRDTSIQPSILPDVILNRPALDVRDNYLYRYVILGNQVWMAENLRYLPNVTGAATGSVTDPHCYVYGYNGTNVAEAKETFAYQQAGAMYNWAAAMNGAEPSDSNPSGVQGICPDGWHLPSAAEWAELDDYLANNGYNYDGSVGGGLQKIAKSMATGTWGASNTTGAVGNSDYPEYKNKSGFSALAGGYRNNAGVFDVAYYITYFRSTSQWNFNNAKFRMLHYDLSDARMEPQDRSFGAYIRCVKD